MTPPSAAAVHPRRTAAAPAPRPRRVSGPARAKAAPRPSHPAQRSARAETGVAVGLLAALNKLSRHRLLDRLIGGRAWIGLVAFALIGIVTLQLGLLELNASIGRSLEREGLLQRENAALSIEDSELAAGNRVESRATALGMELVPIAALRFLTARPGIDATRAAGALRTPAKAPSPASGEAGTEAAAGTPGATSVAAPTGEQAGAPSAASTLAAQAASSPASEQATTPSEASESGVASPGAGAPATPETGAPEQSPAPSSSQPAPAGGGSAEASPAGGTQAGSTG